jgi:hypothetical protein
MRNQNSVRESKPPTTRPSSHLSVTDPLVPLEAFALNPTVLHLNHGSVGAAPRAA